jgi:hypothetical protein
MPRTKPETDDLIGQIIASGSFEVHAHMARFWAEVNDLPFDYASEIHPSFVPFLALDGLGATIEEILGAVGTSPEAGGVAGGLGLELIAPVEIGETYSVECEITEIDHKDGRQSGPFDRVTTMFTMSRSTDSEVVARSWILWIVPREEADADDS